MKTFFISSTFKDMQAERDILHEQIFPRLRQLIKGLGGDVQEVDLRWGVDTVNMSEEESGHEVLRICIDAIDRCKPYMIVLLGERYGWIPNKAMVDSAGDLRISDRYEEEMSITELEIQYGALLNDDAFDNCIFCFRDPAVIGLIDAAQQPYYRTESPLHARRLAALKKQIRARENAIILEYTAGWDPARQTLCDLDDFTRQLYLQLETMIRRDFAEYQAKSLMEQQIAEVELIRSGYLSSYVRRYPEEFWIARRINDFQREITIYNGKRKTDCLLVSGAAGSGKSALMAYMASSVPSLQGKSVLCFAAASGCKDVAGLKRNIAYNLETVLSQPHNEAPTSIDQRLRTLDKKADGLGIVCFVDALDQIYQGQSDPYLDLPALCPSIFWVFSALPDFPFARAAADYTYHSVPVGGLLAAQRGELISRTAKKRGKKLDDRLIGMITGSKGAHNPLFLSLALQRLFMMNKAEFEAAEAIAPGMEGLHRYMHELLSQMPDLPERMAAYILDATAKLFDQGQFSEILMLIACSHNGLTEKELEGLLEQEGIRFSPIKFQQIVSYLYDAFDQRSNGKWTFHHRLFGEAILNLMTAEDQARISRLLAEFVLSDPDFLQQEGFRYLLAQQHEAFVRVLENSGSWPTKAEVCALVGTAARDRADIRDFLTRLVKQHPTDAMAGFWLGFEEFLYGPDVDAMAAEMIELLLAAPVSDAKKWQLALRRTYDVRWEETLPLLTLAEECAKNLPEPDRTVANASIQANLARSLTILRKPYEQIHAIQRESIAAANRALTLLDRQSPWKHYITVFDSLNAVLFNTVSWEDPEADRLWQQALERLEAVSPATGEQEDDHTYYLILFLSQICEIYCRKTWRNYEKAQQFGSRALELADVAASQRPTIRNLKSKYAAIRSYIGVLKEEHTWSYRKQLVDCARQIYALHKTSANKLELANTEAQCGLSYFYAVKANVMRSRTELREEAIDHMNRGFALFEELQEAGYNQSQLSVHASLLVERLELFCDPPEKGLECGHRALALIQSCQQESRNQYNGKTDERSRKQHLRQLNWCTGWSARANTAMASVYQEQLDFENSLRYAREGLALAQERSKTSSAYYTEILSCALIIAQSNYCLRRDDEALAACDETTSILDAIGSQGSSREPMDAELLYIRSRIALERGQADAAWQYCQACLSKQKTALLIKKALILKADCLQAIGDPRADEAWADALRVWHEECKPTFKSLLSESRKILSLNAVPPKIQCPWRTESKVTLPAYYMAYCYHHYVTTQKRLNQYFDVFEQKVLAAVYYLEKGPMKGKLPFGMTEEMLEGYSDAPIPDCPDFQDFVSVLESMTDFHGAHADPSICKVILRNIEKFPDIVPDRDQFNTLQSIGKILYDQLFKENHALYSEKQESDLLQALFRPEKPFPTCRVGWGGQLEIWPRDYAEDSGNRWHALLKLLLLLMRYNSVVNKNNFSKLSQAYRVVSSRIGGSEDIEKSDLGYLSDQDLRTLLRVYDMEHELRIIFSNAYWYALKNVWTAELYRRTGDARFITQRLQTYEEFLTEPYVQLYQRLDARGKTDMPTELVDAAKQFVRALNARGGDRMALSVVRWAESVPALAGRLDSRTLYSVQTFRDEDQLWLDETKFRHCRTWLSRYEDPVYAAGLA